MCYTRRDAPDDAFEGVALHLQHKAKHDATSHACGRLLRRLLASLSGQSGSLRYIRRALVKSKAALHLDEGDANQDDAEPPAERLGQRIKG